MSLYTDAREVIAGGVNSPVRAFAGVGGEPVFFKSAKGARVQSEDGKEYIDYVGSWGPMILGHSHPDVMEAVVTTARSGLSFGAPCVLETRIAEKICAMLPSVDKVRMVSSGTEATMSAIRLARGHTGRDKIVKFEGCYHGHSDSLLIKAGSGALTLGVPSSPGVPAGLAEHTITLPYNDIDAVKAAFAEIGDQIACVVDVGEDDAPHVTSGQNELACFFERDHQGQVTQLSEVALRAVVLGDGTDRHLWSCASRSPDSGDRSMQLPVWIHKRNGLKSSWQLQQQNGKLPYFIFLHIIGKNLILISKRHGFLYLINTMSIWYSVDISTTTCVPNQ